MKNNIDLATILNMAYLSADNCKRLARTQKDLQYWQDVIDSIDDIFFDIYKEHINKNDM